MEPPVEQDPSDVVTCQPRATTDISTLGVVIKALLGGKESHGCDCLLCPEEESQQVASALLIGTKTSQVQDSDGQASGDGHCYISSLKQHLTQLHVEVFRCEPDYRGSLDDLYRLISNFFTKSNTRLFVLYCSGPTNDTGDLSITTTNRYGQERCEYVWLDIIAKKWKTAKQGSDSYLLIIVDAEGSERWRENVKEFESESKIIIMTSSGSGVENPGPQYLGQYTRSIIGSQGRGFFPRGAEEMIQKYLARDSSSTDGLVCYLCNTFAYYK